MTVVRVAGLGELVPGRALLVEVAGYSLGLFLVDGTVVAWRNHCPHMGAPVCRGRVTGTAPTTAVYRYDWGRDGEILQCPWHGWEFDLKTGRHLVSGSPVRLRPYPVELRGTDVFVDLPKPP